MDQPLPTTTLEAPIFDPRAFRLTPFEADLTTRAREFGARILAPRAQKWDREAAFPIDNYRDMHAEGWLGVCIHARKAAWALISAPIASPPPNSAAIAAPPRSPGTCMSAPPSGPAC